MRNLVFLSVVPFFLACASLHEQAREHFESGDYAAAAAVNAQILRKDPQDAVALEHLRKTRQKLIERNLIEARQLRLSNNLAESHRKLRQIVLDEQEWNLSPAGAAFSAQVEETEYLFAWLQGQSELLKKDKKYLKLKLTLEENHNLFVHSDLNSGFQKMEREVEELGSNHCLEFRSLVTGSYSNEFWKHYCVFWGQTVKNEPNLPRTQGFGDVAIKGDIIDLPPEIITDFSNSLLQSLKTSPLYQADGKTLTVNVSGRFTSNYHEEKSTGVHSYDEEIPYEVSETVSYKEHEPVTFNKRVKDPVTKKEDWKMVTEYREVTKYREEKRTRYRKEARSITYPKVDFNVDYVLNSKFNFSLDGVKYSIPLNEKMHVTDSYHEISNPRIGLVEKPKKIPTEIFWLKEQSSAIVSEVQEQMRDSWVNKYCSLQSSQIKASHAEVVLKCVAGAGYAKGIVDNWSNEVFQMPYDQVRKALGI